MGAKVKNSSGNVFADLGIPNPEEALAKAKIVSQIHKIVKKRRLTQAKVAKLLKITQPKVSLLLRGYLKNFSLERLFRFLNNLGQDVFIAVAPSKSPRHGQTCISYLPVTLRVAAVSR